MPGMSNKSTRTTRRKEASKSAKYRDKVVPSSGRSVIHRKGGDSGGAGGISGSSGYLGGGQGGGGSRGRGIGGGKGGGAPVRGA